jgi:hypothetical protein
VINQCFSIVFQKTTPSPQRQYPFKTPPKV